MKALLVLFSLFLFGCEDAQTPEGLYFRVEQDYNLVLTAAVEYKNYCYEIKRTKECYDKVDKIRKTRDKIEVIFREADADLAMNNYKELNVKQVILNSAIKELLLLSTKE